jgi:hypothetical protein
MARAAQLAEHWEQRQDLELGTVIAPVSRARSLVQ